MLTAENSSFLEKSAFWTRVVVADRAVTPEADKNRRLELANEQQSYPSPAFGLRFRLIRIEFTVKF